MLHFWWFFLFFVLFSLSLMLTYIITFQKGRNFISEDILCLHWRFLSCFRTASSVWFMIKPHEIDCLSQGGPFQRYCVYLTCSFHTTWRCWWQNDQEMMDMAWVTLECLISGLFIPFLRYQIFSIWPFFNKGVNCNNLFENCKNKMGCISAIIYYPW